MCPEKQHPKETILASTDLEQPKSASEIIAEAGPIPGSYIRRNMICLIMLDAIFYMGYADLQVAMQPLLVYLHASNTMIGVVTGANFAGLIGVVLSPFITRRFRYKKWYMIVVHVPYLAALGLIGLGIVCHEQLGLADSSLLMYVLVMTLAHWFFAGFVSLPHQEYVAACIPMRCRGRYTGYSFGVGAIASIISAAIGGVILFKVSKPMAFGYLYLMCWGIAQSGYIFAMFARETPTPIELSPKPWSREMVRAAWRDTPFKRFLGLQLITVLLMPTIINFIPIYGFRDLKMIPATAATIAIVGQIGRIVFCPIFGHMTDKLGAKRILPYWSLAGAVPFVIVLLIPNQWGVYISVGIGQVIFWSSLSAMTALIYGLPSAENRAGHYTIQLIVQYAVNALGPIWSGVLLDLLSYRTMFVYGVVMAIPMYLITKHMLMPLSDKSEGYA